jgi:hypothetical protein
MRVKWPWILGGSLLIGGVALLWPSRAAAQAARRNTTIDEDTIRVAKERLAAFLKTAKIDALAAMKQLSYGMMLVVVPGKKFVSEDAAAIPRSVSGIDVDIKGWPR